MQTLSLNRPRTYCVIHCWQYMKFSEVFDVEQYTVTIENFYQWIKSKFSGVIPFSIRCSVRVYHLPDLKSWDKRIRLDDTETLRSSLMLVSNDMSLKSYIVVSIKEDSPTNSPCDDNASTHQSSAVSSLTSNSRGGVQENFHRRVLTRDGSWCVFCGDCVKAHLFAAHIFEFFLAADIPDDDAEFLQRYNILDFYDTENGITLCGECHGVFDALLCCVKVECDSDGAVIGHKILVADALKWSKLDGTSVTVPTKPAMLKHWPPADLFQFREAKYDEYAVQRRQLAQDLPNVCRCGRRTKSIAGLASHMRSKTCLERMTSKSNKFSKPLAPAKTPTAKKQRSRRRKPMPAGKALFSPERK